MTEQRANPTPADSGGDDVQGYFTPVPIPAGRTVGPIAGLTTTTLDRDLAFGRLSPARVLPRTALANEIRPTPQPRPIPL
jgi:hypothetical protein